MRLSSVLAAVAVWATFGVPLAARAGDPGGAPGARASVIVRATSAVDVGMGAGTIVSEDEGRLRILTAKHVATYGPLTIVFDDGSTVPATIEFAWADRDLALVDAQVDPAYAATNIRASDVGAPRPNEALHLWGSGVSGTRFKLGYVERPGGDLPDGPARSRFAFDCRLCAQGDSGAGVFAPDGTLVGVYIGYFLLPSEREHVAELPADGPPGWKIARSKTSATPTIASAVGATPSRTALANTPSSNTINVSASASLLGAEMISAASSALK